MLGSRRHLPIAVEVSESFRSPLADLILVPIRFWLNPPRFRSTHPDKQHVLILDYPLC